MKQIPGFVMRHRCVVESFLGTNAVGEVYGLPAEIRCHFIEQIKMVRNSNGEEVASSSSYTTLPTHLPPENSRVTTPLGGKKRKVVAIESNTWPGMNVPANTRVYLD